MYLSHVNGAIPQPDTCNAFAFAPAATPVELSQPGDFTNCRARRERLDFRNLADDLEMHPAMVPR
jgi:hypothetical protein